MIGRSCLLAERDLHLDGGRGTDGLSRQIIALAQTIWICVGRSPDGADLTEILLTPS